MPKKPVMIDYICLRCDVAGRDFAPDPKCWYCRSGDRLQHTLWSPGTRYNNNNDSTIGNEDETT